MNYSQAIEYIESTSKFGIVPGLDSIQRLLKALGNPHQELSIIHVAGTNGKGSTSSFIYRVLIEAGYSAGLFSSPAIECFNERYRINGNYIDNDDLAEIVSRIKNASENIVKKGYPQPTRFEILTAIAFIYYADQSVDYLVLEVGLGGRLDATNVIKSPLISVITPIALDHTDILGDTYTKIAHEKAGIIKEAVPVVVANQEKEAMEAIRNVANDKNSSIYVIDKSFEIKNISFDGTVYTMNDNEYALQMIGQHQVENSVLAIKALEVLKASNQVSYTFENLKQGLYKNTWPCRLEMISRKPNILLDGAHNPQGAMALKNTLVNHFKEHHIIALVGILADKNVEDILQEILPIVDSVVLTQPDNKRALSVTKLEKLVVNAGYSSKIIGVDNNLKHALELALNYYNDNDLIVGFGSFYTVGPLRTLLKKSNNLSI